jgi:serine/threonine protein kinase
LEPPGPLTEKDIDFVRDVDHIREKSAIATELFISSLVSDLVRRGVCPNFLRLHGVFNCPFAPPASHWGTEDKKAPKGKRYDPQKKSRQPRQPKQASPGRYYYIRMELCDCGDAEEYIKAQPAAKISPRLARSLLFQTAFALHAADGYYNMKHYDLKLLNLFLQRIPESDEAESVVLRYGLGAQTFAIQMAADESFYAKLADFGTANVEEGSTGQPVTVGQFTTIENTPPDHFILGDRATQGHWHDRWGLGLCMLHLFTGAAPYEEIMEEIVCPSALQERLRIIWEEEIVEGYGVIRQVIFSDVELDEAGNIVDGKLDKTPYHTLYRVLVLFGIPEELFSVEDCPMVWEAIVDTLVSQDTTARSQYLHDCEKFSILSGDNKFIARAREALTDMDGGLELLFGLCDFNPATRWSVMDVMNSRFMSPLREAPGTVPTSYYGADTLVHSFRDLRYP